MPCRAHHFTEDTNVTGKNKHEQQITEFIESLKGSLFYDVYFAPLLFNFGARFSSTFQLSIKSPIF